MYRVILPGLFICALAIPLVEAGDQAAKKEQGKAASPKNQYAALLKEYEKATSAFQETLRKAKTPDEQSKIFLQKNPKPQFTPKFVALAQKYPKDAIAIDALIWVLTGDFGPPVAGDARAKAMALLLRDHSQNVKLAAICQTLTSGFDKDNVIFLRSILEKCKVETVRAEACLALARSLAERVQIAKQLQTNPSLDKRIGEFLGKPMLAELKRTNVAETEAQSLKYFTMFGEKHLAKMPAERLRSLCQTFSYSHDKGSEALVREILARDTRREVQGMALLTLAQILKHRSDRLTPAEMHTLKKLQKESEKLFERALAKYADVKLPFRGTVGAKAKTELYELHNLAVGLKAPEVQGVDQDGKKFKLSDYKGKVVLLDFWSEY